MVDLLVSLAYVAAVMGTLDEPLPRGLSLKVPDIVDGKAVDDSWHDFDTLTAQEMRLSIRNLIDTLPPVRISLS
jgi:ubiquitin-conjugating enzyme E2 Q